LKRPLSKGITERNASYWNTIRTECHAIVPDLQGLNKERYSSTITFGLQELIEAIIFQHYIENMNLLSYFGASEKLAHLTEADGAIIKLSTGDYLLGVLDMTGEMMKYSITAIAVRKAADSEVTAAEEDAEEITDINKLSYSPERAILTDLYELCACIEACHSCKGSISNQTFLCKITTMRESVIKVEKTLYSKAVRGIERPKGWLPEFDSPQHETLVRNDIP
jgi:hypothetical protein